MAAKNIKRTKRHGKTSFVNAVTIPSSNNRFLDLRKELCLPRKTFARMMAVSERSLASIESGEKASEAVVRRGNELRRVVNALEEVINKEMIGLWMLEPNEAFNGLKPIEVIERGEIDRIWKMIFYLKAGIAF